MKFGDRFWSQNRWSIPEWKSITDFSGTVFDRDRDREFKIKIGIRLEFPTKVRSKRENGKPAHTISIFPNQAPCSWMKFPTPCYTPIPQ